MNRIGSQLFNIAKRSPKASSCGSIFQKNTKVWMRSTWSVYDFILINYLLDCSSWSNSSSLFELARISKQISLRSVRHYSSKIQNCW